MELVKVAPSRHALPEVGIHRLGHKLICDVHSDLAEVFSHVFQHDTHHTAVLKACLLYTSNTCKDREPPSAQLSHRKAADSSALGQQSLSP